MIIIEHQLEFSLIREDKLNRKTEALLRELQKLDENVYWTNAFLEVKLEEYFKHQENLKQRRKELGW